MSTTDMDEFNGLDFYSSSDCDSVSDNEDRDHEAGSVDPRVVFRKHGGGYHKEIT